MNADGHASILLARLGQDHHPHGLHLVCPPPVPVLLVHPRLNGSNLVFYRDLLVNTGPRSRPGRVQMTNKATGSIQTQSPPFVMQVSPCSHGLDGLASEYLKDSLWYVVSLPPLVSSCLVPPTALSCRPPVAISVSQQLVRALAWARLHRCRRAQDQVSMSVRATAIPLARNSCCTSIRWQHRRSSRLTIGLLCSSS